MSGIHQTMAFQRQPSQKHPEVHATAVCQGDVANDVKGAARDARTDDGTILRTGPRVPDQLVTDDRCLDGVVARFRPGAEHDVESHATVRFASHGIEPASKLLDISNMQRTGTGPRVELRPQAQSPFRERDVFLPAEDGKIGASSARHEDVSGIVDPSGWAAGSLIARPEAEGGRTWEHRS